jgi:hypothetical protein
MITNNNPWANMSESSKRRIGDDTDRNLFWVTDLRGDYGFYIQTAKAFDDTKWTINLKGISVLKRNSDDGSGELFLVLTNKDDWQIFKILCDDLIAEALRCADDEKMIGAVETRLKRWQRLLRQDVHREMTLEVQMGLFSELLCLRDIIAPKIGIEQAVSAWVAPDFDKQDFLMDNSAVEVKSYRASKGSTVSISSVQQLSSDKEFLFLVAYGLTESANGLSAADIADSIKDLLKMQSDDVIDLFENKLAQYGYIPELIKEPLIKFIADKSRAYTVADEFPKIDPKNIHSQITAVKYSIDLSRCSEFEVDLNTVSF